MALSALLRDSMVYILRVVGLSPQILVYWNTAQCFTLWASSGATSGATDTIQKFCIVSVVPEVAQRAKHCAMLQYTNI